MMAFITTQRTLLALLSLYSLLITTTAFHVHSPSPPSAIDTHNIHNPIAGPLGVRPRQAQKPRLSTNGRCGPQTAAGWRCPATVEEQAIIDGKGETPELKSLELKCCSAQGYCGGTGEHCGRFFLEGSARPRSTLGLLGKNYGYVLTAVLQS